MFCFIEARKMASSTPRFDLYVKAGADGVCFGDCPFSHRCYMFMLLHVPQEKFKIITVDTSNKPPEFLQLNPGKALPFYNRTLFF